MKSYRNLIIGVCIGVFVLCYGTVWAYRTQYKEPRKKLDADILAYKEANTKTEEMNNAMSKFVQDNLTYYTRSFPMYPNAAKSLYMQWISELAKFCDMDVRQLDSLGPTQAAYGYVYRFNVSGQCTADGIAKFLYEFYWAPYLHRIVSLKLLPIEKSQKLQFEIVMQGTALYPKSANESYPLADKLPDGVYKRLASGPFSTYNTVSERNLLHYERSGVDRADYTFIAAINYVDGEPVLWFTDRTVASEEPIEVKLNQEIKIGSFIAKFVDASDENVIFQRSDGTRWLLTSGEPLTKAFAIAPELW